MQDDGGGSNYCLVTDETAEVVQSAADHQQDRSLSITTGGFCLLLLLKRSIPRASVWSSTQLAHAFIHSASTTAHLSALISLAQHAVSPAIYLLVGFVCLARAIDRMNTSIYSALYVLLEALILNMH
jgi:hypothetical protein